ncbi:MAG TPA: SPOR domain-containing protein [Desulfobacteraceae bacterium]|nr:SPOR domain-containing protein [Desulfobacteraceae bacterium]HPJ68862.1 SPOR domain-containing protein [Desulfobacteraceae bacterium]
MANPNPKIKKEGKKYHFEFSLSFVFFSTLGLIFLLGWIFILGILVGRGFLPKGIKTLSELRVPITKFQDMVSGKTPSHVDLFKDSEKDHKFAFYDELSRKKEEVAKKNDQSPDKNIVQPKTETKKDQSITAIQPDKRAPIKKPEGNLNAQQGKQEADYVYALQIASLESEIKAADMVNRLVNLGYPAYFYKLYIKEKLYYRVRCGPFNTEKEANDFKKLLLKRENIKGFISKIAK